MRLLSYSLQSPQTPCFVKVTRIRRQKRGWPAKTTLLRLKGTPCPSPGYRAHHAGVCGVVDSGFSGKLENWKTGGGVV